VLDAPFSGHAKPDAERLVDAIRSGRAYTVVDGLAGPGLLDFSAEEPGGAVHGMGSVLKPGPVRLRVHASMPEGADLFILQNGAELARQREGTFDREIHGRGAVRVEVQIPGAPGIPPVPWLVSNPIYFLDEARTTAEPKPAVEGVPVAIATTWHAEKDPSSAATVSASGDGQRLEYRLRPDERASQFAAMAGDLGPHETFAYLAFTGRGSGPMRVSVQLRYPGSGGRWGSSVYLDGTSRDAIVPVDRLQPLDRQDRPAEDAKGARTLLFVVDLTHAKPGQAGTFEISRLRFLR
jgi:hypothetical protein